MDEKIQNLSLVVSILFKFNSYHHSIRSEKASMECPKCGFETRGNALECPRCGLIFSKFKPKSTAAPVARRSSPKVPDELEIDVEGDSPLWTLFFGVKPKTDSYDLALRAACVVVFVLWGLVFIFSSVNDQPFGSGFWHLINLPFHEAGHIIFRPFGRLITSLGGTLGQLLMPLICMGVLLVKTRDPFGAAFCVWWLGQNFMDIAPYIDDARRLTMPLLGGNTGQTSPYGFHDWEFILTETRLIRFDHTFAWLSHALGVCLMLLAFAWWGYLLYLYVINLESSKN